MATAAVTSRGSGGVFIVFIIFIFSALSSTRGETADRQLTVELNPGSPSRPPGGDLLSVRAVGPNDTLHYLFSSQGAPTLLLVHTDSNISTVKVNWTQFNSNTSGGLKVEPESSVLYSNAIVLTRLFEYNDVNNTADPSSSESFFPPYDLQNFTWNDLQLSGSEVIALVCGSAPFSNGSLCLQLSVYESSGRAVSWPRLLHTADSSQLSVWLDGLLPRATRSRFLLELVSVGGANTPDSVEVHRTIDDEFTPTIFKSSHWVHSSDSSFVAWRPVAWRRSVPSLEDAVPCHHSAPAAVAVETLLAASQLIRGFYSADPTQAQGLNISFGLAGTPFYNSTRYLRWTALVGLGAPPLDSFSPLVLSMMAVGLGFPMILLVLGAVCLCVRKKASPSTTAYEPIN